MFKQWIKKQAAREYEDQMRATYNLRPRKADWDEKLIIGASCLLALYFVLLLAEGVLR